MKQSLSFFSSQMGIGITEDKTNSCKEITFTGTIATDDDIVLG